MLGETLGETKCRLFFGELEKINIAPKVITPSAQNSQQILI